MAEGGGIEPLGFTQPTLSRRVADHSAAPSKLAVRGRFELPWVLPQAPLPTGCDTNSAHLTRNFRPNFHPQVRNLLKSSGGIDLEVLKLSL